jgi:hypothetical protein
MEWQYEQFATSVMIYVVMNIWWIIVWIEGQPNIALRRYGLCQQQMKAVECLQ